MGPCHQLCVCPVPLPVAPESTCALCLSVTDSCGVLGDGGERRSPRFLVKYKKLLKGHGLQGKNHLLRGNGPADWG